MQYAGSRSAVSRRHRNPAPRWVGKLWLAVLVMFFIAAAVIGDGIK